MSNQTITRADLAEAVYEQVGLSRNEGVTVFLSTHFMAEAEWCDRISLMHEGQVLACDTPERLKKEPESPSKPLLRMSTSDSRALGQTWG